MRHESVADRAVVSMGSGRSWLAIQKGYKVLEIFEVYEYSVTQYDLCTCEGGLFVDHINTFLEL